MIWAPHVTVAAIAERDKRFLMVEEMVDGSVVINQPAGHLEPGESLIEAVRRESLEETGWIFEPSALVGIHLWKPSETSETFLRVSFTGHCTDHDPDRELDTGIMNAAWFSRDELVRRSAALRSPLVLEGIDDYLAGIRYPLTLLKSMLPSQQPIP